jgi:hypothetical protein
MSALAPEAGINRRQLNVRYGPKADFAQFATNVPTLTRQKPQLCSHGSLSKDIT